MVFSKFRRQIVVIFPYFNLFVYRRTAILTVWLGFLHFLYNYFIDYVRIALSSSLQALVLFLSVMKSLHHNSLSSSFFELWMWRLVKSKE